MTPRASIEKYAGAIAREFNPHKIILFGSHAYGEPNADSDVDLMVVMPKHRRTRRTATDIRLRLGYSGFPLDLLVWTSERLREWSQAGDGFTRDILDRGQIRARSSMNALTRSWVRKAERDFKVAQGLMRRWVAGYGDAACFHSLVAGANLFPRTHDLSALLALLLPGDPMWKSFDAACQILTRYAVDVRYPGDDATKRDAQEALNLATAIRREARHALGLRA